MASRHQRHEQASETPFASTPMRINDVGAHQTGDRDFARASPSGKAIANRTPSAIG